jgi:hypothetical protein
MRHIVFLSQSFPCASFPNNEFKLIDNDEDPLLFGTKPTASHPNG